MTPDAHDGEAFRRFGEGIEQGGTAVDDALAIESSPGPDWPPLELLVLRELPTYRLGVCIVVESPPREPDSAVHVGSVTTCRPT